SRWQPLGVSANRYLKSRLIPARSDSRIRTSLGPCSFGSGELAHVRGAPAARRVEPDAEVAHRGAVLVAAEVVRLEHAPPGLDVATAGAVPRPAAIGLVGAGVLAEPEPYERVRIRRHRRRGDAILLGLIVDRDDAPERGALARVARARPARLGLARRAAV